MAVSDLAITTGRSTLVPEVLAFEKVVIDVSKMLGHESYYDYLPSVSNHEELLRKVKEVLEVKSVEKFVPNYKEILKEEFGEIKGAISRAVGYIKDVVRTRVGIRRPYKKRVPKVCLNPKLATL